MTYDILATGSTGNAVAINGEILIDCGVPYKTLERSGHIKNLKLVLLTHEHGDHFNPATVGRLHQERPALRWGCCEWMVKRLLDADVSKKLIDVYEIGKTYRYNGLATIRPEKLFHDVENCGYHITFENGERLFYATDTGYIDSVVARNYEWYFIERNHTQAEIAARIADKQARGEFAYEYRAAQNHLSQEQAWNWLAENAGPNSRRVFLHQHKAGGALSQPGA